MNCEICEKMYKFLRILMLLICIGVSCFQLTICFGKLRDPPTSTHYAYFLNESLWYPSVTICRNPPFKTELFEKYGFLNSEITYATTWKRFKYDQYSIQGFFEEVTYAFNEIVSIAALDELTENLRVTSYFSLTHGRCFTLSPKRESTRWGGRYGYYLYLAPDSTNTLNWNGIHVYIHEGNDKLTEKNGVDIFEEHLFVEAGDSVQVNLKVSRYNQLPNRRKECNSSFDYSKSSCVEEGVNDIISTYVGCQVPWVPNEKLPECNSYKQLMTIVTNSTASTYLQETLRKSNCIRKCKRNIYLPLLQSIREIEPNAWSLRIYFSSNLISQMDEVIAYDWNTLIADLGGSLGFLLGLSVFGSIGLIESAVAKIKGKSIGAICPSAKKDTTATVGLGQDI
ncbi:hypothetical protein RI129_010400 [Pyrocoelia pectoralis]|uniref:Uncharacterized protein n=1 Tax=Pyrocoelia pectoralis TaxID=417401 RepID=A0AAN7VAE2_9COLE